MFGYVSPDMPYLFKKDEVLYKALYCGLCKSIGKGCGGIARTALTYDLTFASALVHNIRGEDVKIEKQRCITHQLRKRPVAIPDETSIKCGYVNTILTYYKLSDDKEDGDKKGALRIFYKKAYKRAAKRCPQIDEIAARFTAWQRQTEKSGCASLDIASEPTAAMMREIGDYLLGEFKTAATSELFYQLGKWIYLIDALDDFEKDKKKGAYNVLSNAFGGGDKAEILARGGDEIKFVFDTIFAEMRKNLAAIDFKFNRDLTDNIILRGIPAKTRAIFYGECGGCKKEN